MKKKMKQGEFYKMMIKMSTIPSQKENENAVISSGQMPNAIVRRWMGKRHSPLGAEFPVNHWHVAYY